MATYFATNLVYRDSHVEMGNTRNRVGRGRGNAIRANAQVVPRLRGILAMVSSSATDGRALISGYVSFDSRKIRGGGPERIARPIHGSQSPRSWPPHPRIRTSRSARDQRVTPPGRPGTCRMTAACIVHVRTYTHYTLHSNSFLHELHTYTYKKNIYIKYKYIYKYIYIYKRTEIYICICVRAQIRCTWVLNIEQVSARTNEGRI